MATTGNKREIESRDRADGAVVAKQHKVTLNNIADEWICPITMELPLHPVTAEDGHIYERSAIERWIEVKGNDLKSPQSNDPMGPRLLSAPQAGNTIEQLVRSGTIDRDKAQSWKKRIKDEETIKVLKKRAENSDNVAFFYLGRAFFEGELGQKQDFVEAYHWFKKGSDQHYPPAMALAGSCLVRGKGVEENVSEGMVLTALAANSGSDYAALNLGCWYYRGICGLQRNPDKAKYWLKKCIEPHGKKEFRTLAEHPKTRAKYWIEKLEDRN